jgi:hypothetical protein
MPLACLGSENDKSKSCKKSPETPKMGPFIGYPMAALTGSSVANKSMTYPVVI